MKNILLTTGLVLLATSFSSIANPKKPGGDTTTTRIDENAFSLPAANLDFEGRLNFSTGNSFFRNPWVVAPATTIARDGLGPLFNTNGCQNCHLKDGRGHPAPVGATNAVSMLVRISIPAVSDEQKATEAQNGVVPEPTYGGQIQDQANPGIKPEARVRFAYTDKPFSFADGSSITLRDPELIVDQLGYGEMHPDTMFSPRIASPMIGLGLLESISEQDILANADPDDSNNDGIRGLANRVWDAQQQQFTLGRFGWKAGQPNLMQQNAAAFNGDIGITSLLFSKDHCTAAQIDCLTATSGVDPDGSEVSDKLLGFVEFYTQHLAVPKRRIEDAEQVALGDTLFSQVSCDSCHKRSFTTAKRDNLPALSEQIIYPYTDMLLHDMGPELADGRGEYLANGQQWRTPPLWGVGLTETVNGHSQLLHDGRARNVTEAIVWHDGEAEPAKQAFAKLDKTQREALVAFVNSL
ncbi:di-heme oxidoredictase family protein [Agarivorans sp. 1_MG-2023]|uniref:di-heme oxidoreductase family protein n=1 Tax=Agarivorans sp. 1_MG-2023 TaxID=3062634 RepID=UPI0026E1B375|nr:di-heme oxidoredictase family protein [Agarivorans sp. 1_MG-2023]MDO6762813.1 di-heme oxidoredictase family protein [Agarivorans sp. 1_MG-2023]